MYKPKIKVRNCVDCKCEIRATGFKRSVKETRCKSCAHKGVRHHRWNGGQKNSHGYIRVKNPDHPHADENGYVQKSHLVWETANGRLVKKGEIIHHIDGSRDNDVIENLQLMTRSKHMSLHHKGKDNPAYKHGKYIGRKAKYKKNKQIARAIELRKDIV
jgi:flagellar basal body rod protein FlgC